MPIYFFDMVPTSPRVHAGIYCRISDDRAQTGLGVERQRKDCVRLAAKLGWAVADTYIDNDISAYNGARRPEYERLLADISQGNITGLITWHPDRLNRSPLELERLINLLERHSVALQSVTAGVLDLTTPSGRAVARTLGAWARYESEHKSERIKAKLRELALAGAPIGSSRRYGYAEDRVTIVDAEADVIREVMRRFLAGESLLVVSRSLNARRIPCASGGVWNSAKLGRVLDTGRIAGWRDKPIVRGARRHPPTEFLAPGKWPAIVSKRSVQRARELLHDETRRPGSHRRWLLSDLMVCGTCGKTLISTCPDRPDRRYRCINRRGHGIHRNGCSIVWRADDTVTEQIHAAVADGLIDRIVAAGIDVSENATKLDRNVDSELRKLRTQRAEGLVTGAQFRSEMTRLSFIKTRTSHNAAEVMLADLGTLRRSQFPKNWASAEISRRRAIVQALTEEIRVMPHVGGNMYDPSRVTITWRSTNI